MQTVLTHSGNFHPDDVLAVAALQLYLGKDNVEVVRSRDPEAIKDADWVVDVGGVYDVKAQRFDHHQNNSLVRENGIPYAAIGLVWKEFGEQICGSKKIADYIENVLVQPTDAGDNAVGLYTLNDYNVSPYELYNILHSYRPLEKSSETSYSAFINAVDFARGLLERIIAHSKANEATDEYIRSVYDKSDDKGVLVFEESVHRQALVQFPEVNVIVYPSESEEGKIWKASTVPVAHKSFDSRVDFPAEWSGLRDYELTTVSGIGGAVFCHKDLFLVGFKTKEGAIEAARMAS